MSMSDIGDDVTAAVVIQQQQHRQPQHHHQQQQQQTTLAQLQQHDLVNLNIMPVLTSDNEIINIPKEIILISLVSQEQALYNPKHENYRNAQHKDGKWLDIADNVGWTEIQCKSKWKAMRDQYCRELKRSKFNAKANVKWKYFKELEFLRPYALSRNYRPRHVNSNVNNNNNNNNINNNSITSNNNNNSNNNLNNVNKIANIKIEPGPFGSCDFTTAVVTTTSTNTNVTSVKNEPVRLLTPLTDEQLNSVIQQQQQQQVDGNWSYLTAATTTLTSTSLQQQQQHQQQQQQNATSSDEALLSAFVNCVAAVTATQNNNNTDLQQQQQQQQHLLVQNVQQTPHTTTMDEEDDDPIHTFLNIESYFEKELIAMIQQHDILYNRYHPNYRNVKRKLEVWDEIARKLKKTVKQCRLKWKAFRDQYIREHKRLKNRENAESLPRWKHYDALSFLQKYIKHKSNDATEPKSLMQISKTALNITDMDEQLIDSSPLNISPLRSPTLPETLTELSQQQQQQQHDQLQLHTLPSLTGPHTQQQQQQQQQQNTTTTTTHDDDDDEAMCAVGTSNGTDDNDDAGSVTGYDEMDIDTYIIGDESNEPTTRDDVDGEVSDTATAVMIDEPNDAEDDVDKEKSPAGQFVTAYSQHSEQSMSNQQIIDKFDELKTMTPDATKVQLKIEEINVVMGNDVVDVVLDGTMQQSAQQQQQNFVLNNSVQCSAATATTTNTTATLLLNGNNNNSNNNNNGHHISIDTTTNTTTTTNNNNSLSNGMATPNGISPNINSVSVAATTVMPMTTTSPAAAAVATASPAAVTSDDDEVGAFFKAVAMKIRNAKMSPIAFTDLQIEILRVINGSLRQY